MKSRVLTTMLAAAVMWLPRAAEQAGAAAPQSPLIARIAASLKIDTAAVHGANLNVDAAVKHSGKTLRLRTNALGDISHIGYRLFNDEVVAAYPDSRVFDFVERYALELRLKTDTRVKTVQDRLALDGVTVTQGSVDMIYGVTGETPLTVDYIPRRMYRFTWTFGNGRKLGIVFKADCHLITGTDAVGLEQRFSRDVVRCRRIAAGEAMRQWDKARVSVSGGRRVVSTGVYLSEAITDKLLQNLRNSSWSLVMSPKSAVRSICNIMLTGGCETAADIPMQLVVDKYGYSTDTLSITLGQLGKYLVEDGCRVYVGVKKTSSDGLHGTLFVVNEAMGYNHVVPFVCPLSVAEGKAATVKAHIYTYIPLQNVTEKFFNQYVTYEKYE